MPDTGILGYLRTYGAELPHREVMDIMMAAETEKILKLYPCGSKEPGDTFRVYLCMATRFLGRYPGGTGPGITDSVLVAPGRPSMVMKSGSAAIATSRSPSLVLWLFALQSTHVLSVEKRENLGYYNT